jgi:hypothetical protein
MGWWKIDQSNDIIGDSPVDTITETLETIVLLWEEQKRPKPTVVEILNVIASALRLVSTEIIEDGERFSIQRLIAQIRPASTLIYGGEEDSLDQSSVTSFSQALRIIARQYQDTLSRNPRFKEIIACIVFVLGANSYRYLSIDQEFYIDQIWLETNHKREVFKDAAYFDTVVRIKNQNISKYQLEIAQSQQDKTNLYTLLFQENLTLLIAQYSRGDETLKLENTFIDVLKALINYYETPVYKPFNFYALDEYITAIWLVAWAFILDIDHKYINLLISIIDSRGKDAFFDSLVSLKSSNKVTSSHLIYPQLYNSLLASLSLQDKQQQANLISDFLRNYYQGCQEVSWHNSHLQNNYHFFGYWCFELAALVKILKLDDRLYANNLFYPRDLTGHKLLRTWEDSEQGDMDRKEYNSYSCLE